MPAHLNIEAETIDAEQRAKRAERDYLTSRRKYKKLQQKIAGPFTVEMIAAQAHYRRALRERTTAKHRLRGLLTIQKQRKK